MRLCFDALGGLVLVYAFGLELICLWFPCGFVWCQLQGLRIEDSCTWVLQEVLTVYFQKCELKEHPHSVSQSHSGSIKDARSTLMMEDPFPCTCKKNSGEAHMKSVAQ